MDYCNASTNLTVVCGSVCMYVCVFVFVCERECECVNGRVGERVE